MNSTQNNHPKSFHHITRVDFVRFDGLFSAFYPGVLPLFAPDLANNLPADFEGIL